MIRNTPFLVQLFFIFFGLPSLGLKITEWQAAVLAMVINLGAYSTEIIRAGIQAIPRGQLEAAAALAMTRFEAFRHVVLLPALGKVWPALSSQIIIVMLGSAVCSQIATEELSFAANFIQSRNFRAFETYALTTLVYLCMALMIRQLLNWIGRRYRDEEQPMSDFSFWDIVRNLAHRPAMDAGCCRWWRLSVAALIGLLVMTMRISRKAFPRNLARTYIELFQGTPLLMQLFLVFFGIALLGVDISPWLAAAIALTLFTSAYLAEIWRGCVESIAHGQWEASASLALNPLEQLRYVILPQALRIAVAPTVGFSVQVVKGTAVTSIIGFTELTKTGGMLANATFEPFMVYGLVALGYFLLCYPLSLSARYLERRLHASA